MKILIIGSQGTIGKQVTKLLEQNNEVITASRTSGNVNVDITKEQMVFAEATSVLPLIASDAYHKGEWKSRDRKNFTKIFK